MRAFARFLTLCSIFSVSLSSAHFYQNFERQLIYEALRSDDAPTIEKQIKSVANYTSNTAAAFHGALLMKQSSLINDPALKLKLFKTGHNKLEEAISHEQNNIEFKFLRLLIQENAPKFLNYNSNLEVDSREVSENYKELSSILQQEIKLYSKKSKVLTPAKLQQPNE